MTESVVPSFWGPVTSTTEWCEKNYTHSSYIAEFFNTISNLPCILLALLGLINALRQHFERRFSVLHVSNMILAIGSMLFHATLRHVYYNPAFIQQITDRFWSLNKHSGAFPVVLTELSCKRQQQSDETPMVWEMLLYLYVLYSPDWHYRSTMPTFLFLYGAAFAIVHSLVRFEVVFKLHYVALCLLCIPRMYKYYIYTQDVAAKRLAQLYVVTLFLGGGCWIFDRIFCKKVSLWYINPQGHAWWHVFMGFNSYYANTFLMFCRAQQLGWQPRVVRLFGFFPYVKIKKPKQQ